jgi:hypothetical protein
MVSASVSCLTSLTGFCVLSGSGWWVSGGGKAVGSIHLPGGRRLNAELPCHGKHKKWHQFIHTHVHTPTNTHKKPLTILHTIYLSLALSLLCQKSDTLRFNTYHSSLCPFHPGEERKGLPDHRGAGADQLGSPRVHLPLPLQSPRRTTHPVRQDGGHLNCISLLSVYNTGHIF